MNKGKDVAPILGLPSKIRTRIQHVINSVEMTLENFNWLKDKMVIEPYRACRAYIESFIEAN